MRQHLEQAVSDPMSRCFEMLQLENAKYGKQKTAKAWKCSWCVMVYLSLEQSNNNDAWYSSIDEDIRNSLIAIFSINQRGILFNSISRPYVFLAVFMWIKAHVGIMKQQDDWLICPTKDMPSRKIAATVWFASDADVLLARDHVLGRRFRVTSLAL